MRYWITADEQENNFQDFFLLKISVRPSLIFFKKVFTAFLDFPRTFFFSGATETKTVLVAGIVNWFHLTTAARRPIVCIRNETKRSTMSPVRNRESKPAKTLLVSSTFGTSSPLSSHSESFISYSSVSLPSIFNILKRLHNRPVASKIFDRLLETIIGVVNSQHSIVSSYCVNCG